MMADRSTRLPVPTIIQALLVLALVSGLIYANSLRNGFVFDDYALIPDNPATQSLAEYPKALEWDAQRIGRLPSDRGTTHRPVRTALLAVQIHLFGPNSIGYHAVNLLLHVLNGLLVFLIVRTLLGRPLTALLAAGLFVAHPIQTEAVAYISGQRDLLYTGFYLAGFLSFVRYRLTQRPRWLAGAFAAYLLGLLSKEMAITLPALCAVYDLIAGLPGATPAVEPPLRRAALDSLRRVLARDTRLYAAGGAVLGLALFYFVFVANPSHRQTLYGGGLGPTVNTSARIVALYLRQLLFPLTLNADYSFNAFPVSTSLADPRGLLALLLLAGIGYGLVRLLRVDRWAAFGGFWFFVTLLPVSQIIPHHELLAEHFLYLPSIGYCLVVAYAVERGLEIRRAAAAVAAGFAIVVLLFGLRTVVRNRDWKDELTLWTKTVQTAPRSARAHLNLAQALRSHQRNDEAIEQFRAHSAILPGSPTGKIGEGSIYRQMGRYADAIAQFRSALELAPNSFAAALGLAQSYAATGQKEQAVELSRRVLGLPFKSERTYQLIGQAFAEAGLHDQAVEAFRKGIELHPRDFRLHYHLGKTHVALRQYDLAIAAYGVALKLSPRLPDLHNSLGAAYLEAGQPEVAAGSFREAIRLAPEYAEAHSNLGIAYYRLGRRVEAEAEFRRALALRPDSPELAQNLALALNRPVQPSLDDLKRAVRETPTSARAHFNLGSTYANQGDLVNAAREYQRALDLDPTNPLIHYAIGLLHAQQGDQESARRSWKQALALDPSFRLANEGLAKLQQEAGGNTGR